MVLKKELRGLQQQEVVCKTRSSLSTEDLKVLPHTDTLIYSNKATPLNNATPFRRPFHFKPPQGPRNITWLWYMIMSKAQNLHIKD